MFINRLLGTQGRGGANYRENTWNAEEFWWICKECKAHNVAYAVKLPLGQQPLCPYCGEEATPYPGGEGRPIDVVTDTYSEASICPRCESNRIYTTLMGPEAWNTARCMSCQAVWKYRLKNGHGEMSIIRG